MHTTTTNLIDLCRCDLQARLSMSFVDNEIDLVGRNFPSPEFAAKFQSLLVIQCR